MRSPMGTRQEPVEEMATGGRAHDELPGLQAMLQELRQAPEVFRSSLFWEHHADLQFRELAEEGGFAAFKRTVNRHFFQFMVTGVRDPQFRAVARQWMRHPKISALLARLEEPLQAPPGSCSPLRLRIAGGALAAETLFELAVLSESFASPAASMRSTSRCSPTTPRGATVAASSLIWRSPRSASPRA